LVYWADRPAPAFQSHRPRSVLLQPEAKIALHVIPYSAFDRLDSIDLADAYGRRHELKTIRDTSKTSRYNLDGFVVYGGRSGDGSGYEAYSQVFRNGITEAVNSYILEGNTGHIDGPTPIPSQLYEDEIIAALNSMVKLLGSVWH